MTPFNAQAKRDLRLLTVEQLRALDLSHRRMTADHQKAARSSQQWADGARKELKRREGVDRG